MSVHHRTRVEGRAELDHDGHTDRVELAIGRDRTLLRWRDATGLNHVIDDHAAVATTLVDGVSQPCPDPVADDTDLPADAPEVAAALVATVTVLRLVIHHRDGGAVLTLAATPDALWLVAAAGEGAARARRVDRETAVAVVLRELTRDVLASEQVFG